VFTACDGAAGEASCRAIRDGVLAHRVAFIVAQLVRCSPPSSLPRRLAGKRKPVGCEALGENTPVWPQSPGDLFLFALQQVHERGEGQKEAHQQQYEGG
jgi:hypothetical protein